MVPIVRSKTFDSYSAFKKNCIINFINQSSMVQKWYTNGTKWYKKTTGLKLASLLLFHYILWRFLLGEKYGILRFWHLITFQTSRFFMKRRPINFRFIRGNF